ncbi:MAG: hypothetical protein JOY62_18535 [Acidobacteriaceae bacterium]|nr:hypothetical protein [Acidobacteriaceae bacterium]MBV9781965.1 hypothetical protein [Acidobacteriaceae bacterium]
MAHLNFSAFWQDDDGQDLVEYSLLLGFLTLTSVAIITSVANNVLTVWNGIINGVSAATRAIS